MGELSEGDVRAVLDFVGEVYDAQDLAEFRSVLLPGIHRLVSSDYVAYNEVEQGSEAVLTINSPELPAWALSAWERHAGENPLLQRFLRTQDGRARRFSEVVSPAELRRTELYAQLYKPLGVEHQIAFTLPSTPELTIGIALVRGGRNFTERDRRVLDLTRPHLIQAYRAAQRRGRLLEQADRVLSLEALRRLGLSPREAEVLQGLARGEDGEAVASRLRVTPRTIAKHVQNIHSKLGVSSRAQAVATAWAAAGGGAIGLTQYLG